MANSWATLPSQGLFISTRQDNTYFGLCYTSCVALLEMRNRLMTPPGGIGINPMTYHIMSKAMSHFYKKLGILFIWLFLVWVMVGQIIVITYIGRLTFMN